MDKVIANRKGRFSDCATWREQYQKKLVNVEEAVQQVRNGDDVAMTGAGSWPQVFEKALARHVKENEYHVNVYSIYMLDQAEVLKPEYVNHIDFYSIFFGQERKNVANKNVHYIPAHLGETGAHLMSRQPRVVVMTCTPPDENGWMSRSIWGSHLARDVFEANACEVVIAEINDQLPYLCSDGEQHMMIHVSEVDYIVEESYAWPEVKTIPSTEVERKIAGYCAEMIDDGTCLQLGQGGLANAIGENLIYAGRKDLGLQTEVLTNCIAGLMRAGVINNSRKNTYPGISVASQVVGDKPLWDFCNNNKNICFKEINWVNDPVQIAKNDNVVSINNAMEVDFVGQVASEAIGRMQYTGSGGQLQWVIGSQMSKGGKSIIAINSTYRDKQGVLRSKIKPFLPEGSFITTPRTYVQYVVTEYGIANLKFKSTRERAEALIAIAHPDFREELRQEARKLLLL